MTIKGTKYRPRYFWLSVCASLLSTNKKLCLDLRNFEQQCDLFLRCVYMGVGTSAHMVCISDTLNGKINCRYFNLYIFENISGICEVNISAGHA